MSTSQRTGSRTAQDNEILTEANRLVSGGLRQAAIELLREGLDSSPDSAPLHGALGRVFLLEGQPEQAVIHLQRSLEIGQARKLAPQSPLHDQDDDFTDDDLAFVDAQAEQHDEIEIPPYDLVPAETSPVEAADGSTPSSHPTLLVAPGTGGPEAGTAAQSETTISYRGRRRIHPQRDTSTGVHRDEKQPSAETQPTPAAPSSTWPPEAKPLADDPALRHPTQLPRQPPVPRQDRSAEPRRDAVPGPPAQSPLGDSDPGEQPPEEFVHNEPEVVLDLDESEIDDDGFSDLVESLVPILDDEEADALSWDDYEDLDDFDDKAQRERPDQSPTADTVSREERARQVAVEVLLGCDWPLSAIDRLQQVFVENGWGAARVAVERELKKGLLPDELELAMDVRHLWSESPRFWTSYQWIGSNAPCMYASAAYRHMSWAEALRIVRCFPALPDIEEVIGLIEDTYDCWYSDNALRGRFKSFLEFLRYRTGSMPRTLPGDCFYDFTVTAEED